MSLRRSSRAPPAHSNSSSSLSSRDRNTRSHNKASSPQKSSSPGSLSSDEPDESGRVHHSEEPTTRRRTRAQDHEGDHNAKDNEDADEDVGDDDEETTRCICGSQEYPGPPSDDEDVAVPPEMLEDVGGLFIQCDKCSVWQHGGCVGIMEEKFVPENYYCEECRKDLHRLMTSPNGQRYSKYRPVVGSPPAKSSHRKSSLSKEPESRSSKDKEKPRASVEASAKRRSTMNSRAAYEDDEVLRQVIEESKSEGVAAVSESGTRKVKRAREESEDVKSGIKRQRTGSGSTSSPAPSEALDSDEEGGSKNNASAQKQKPRGAAARSQQERLQREQKEREKERAEAAGKRKGRAERRRAEDEESTEAIAAPSVETEEKENEAAREESRETPTVPAITSIKRSTKPVTTKRGGRLGRNQYTRDRDMGSTEKTAASPHRTSGRNNTKEHEGESPTGNGAESGPNGSGSDVAVAATVKGVKNGKRTAPSKLDKISWKDMNGTASHMLEYISRVQVEMASEKTSTTTSAMAVVKTLQVVNGDGNGEANGAVMDIDTRDGESNESNYEGLNSLEMMDVLTRNLVHWQQRFGERRDK
ncbi:hypothetical protein K490DRAFT_65959 [Saccharata proteae CBS 121410]|uniref:Zinc finger PHD-type domain-containing protein n=1 Tax=Saccharata proteae CBS 121410 TaxID=1314787 RepID=A0A9P4HW20_9PEZI|nr:hypothetical protein K490DRAFT_65959 [Saccharata proteae CBS 121410]